jgi:hypothetical protein
MSMSPSKPSTKLPPQTPAVSSAATTTGDTCSPEASSGTSTTLPPALANPDTIQTYKTLYDVLGRAYWEASDITAKDTIQGARDAIYEILTDLNIAQLEANTALFLALKTKIRDSNKALEEIKQRINTITKNISTAASVIAAIAKVASIAPMLL